MSKSKKVCSLKVVQSRLSSLSYCAWKLTSLGVILYEYLTFNTSASDILVFTRTRKIPSKDSWGFGSFLNDVKRSVFTGTAISTYVVYLPLSFPKIRGVWNSNPSFVCLSKQSVSITTFTVARRDVSSTMRPLRPKRRQCAFVACKRGQYATETQVKPIIWRFICRTPTLCLSKRSNKSPW